MKNRPLKPLKTRYKFLYQINLSSIDTKLESAKLAFKTFAVRGLQPSALLSVHKLAQTPKLTI